jgi:hypothetical protein
MSELGAKEQYFLILADIAIAAAIKTHDSGYVFPGDGADYVPGSLRNGWLASAGDTALRKRVMAMVSAGVASLQGMTEEQLAAAAEKYGVTLSGGMAKRVAKYFHAKRNAVLSYNR